jgi:predicted acetyltransferase
MLKITKADTSSIIKLLNNYYNDIDTPLDDMWENAIIPSATFYKINDNQDLGHFAIDSNNTLLQFYIKEGFKHLSESVFKNIIEKHKIYNALVATYEHEYLSLCLGISTDIKVDTILYHEDTSIQIASPITDLSMEIANIDQFDEVIDFCTKKVGLNGDWLNFYYKAMLPQQSIYLFRHNDNIVSAGEMRPSKSSISYANVGIMVSKDYRGKNIGTYTLSQMKKTANSKGLKTICSTTTDNIASQKAILKNGYNPYHRIVRVTF